MGKKLAPLEWNWHRGNISIYLFRRAVVYVLWKGTNYWRDSRAIVKYWMILRWIVILQLIKIILAHLKCVRYTIVYLSFLYCSLYSYCFLNINNRFINFRLNLSHYYHIIFYFRLLIMEIFFIELYLANVKQFCLIFIGLRNFAPILWFFKLCYRNSRRS